MSDDLRRAVDDPPEETSSSLRHRARRVHRRMHANPMLSLVSKIVIGVVGTVVLVAGIIMIVTPGPAFVLIPLGLAILATEFTWARRALEKAKEQAVKAKEKAQEGSAGTSPQPPAAARGGPRGGGRGRGVRRGVRLAGCGGGRLELGAEPQRLRARAPGM